MGIVYRAEDERLGRQVALKFLPEKLASDDQALERFQREARAASALNHPNICSIFDIGEYDGKPFIAMELLEGVTLKQRITGGAMKLDDVIELGSQIAEALTVAHEAGIVHRDIKPANLFVTKHGYAKVLDFGLAKLVAQEDDPTGSTEMPTQAYQGDHLTEPGSTIGTVAYMSPEQTLGEDLDPRSDVFSLGAVLYEMITGQLAFSGKTSAMTFDAILHAEPISAVRLRAEVPDEFEHILAKALEKDRNVRYQSAAELKADLLRLQRDSSTRVSAAAATAPRAKEPEKAGGNLLRWGLLAVLIVVAVAVAWFFSRPKTQPEVAASVHHAIAVLPFQNYSGDTTLDHLRMAVPDEITTVLSYTPELSVRPFSATRKFSDPEVDPSQIAQEVQADQIVTGQFLVEDDLLQVTIESIDIDQSRLAWRQRISLPIGDMTTLRSTIGEAVSTGLLPALGIETAATGSVAAVPTDPRAYELFLQESALARDREDNLKAIELLEEVVRLDPEFAPGWSRLGWRTYWLGAFVDESPETYYRQAQASMQRALEIDPELPDALGALIVFEVEIGDLEDGYDRAVSLLQAWPESPQAHFLLSYVYRYGGMLGEAARKCEVAFVMDPERGHRSCSVVYYRLGRFDRARTFLALEPGSTWTTNAETWLRVWAGDLPGAIEIAQTLPDGHPSREFFEACASGNQEAIAQRGADARALEVEDSEAFFHMGAMFATCGETETAIALIRRSIDQNYCAPEAFERDFPIGVLRDHPEWESLRRDSIACRDRFKAYVAQHPAPS